MSGFEHEPYGNSDFCNYRF